MSIDSQGRPAQRMSRFSQAYRTAPANGAVHATLDARAERALNRADAMSEAAMATADWQRTPPPPYADVIEVEFETVPPLPAAPEPPVTAAEPPVEDALQPPPPDIEAIAAALAAEMDRNASAMKPAEVDAAPLAPMPQPAETEAAEAADSAPAIQAESVAAATAESAPQIRHDEPLAPLHAAPATAKPPLTATVSEIQAQLMAMARQAANEAARITRSKVVPALGQAGLWLAHNLRRKEIRRRYGAALALVHGRLLDRQLERNFYLSTLDLQRFAPSADRGILYEGPVPSRAFDWALSQLPADLREFAFVDFRASRGRAMLLASKRNFERIIGFEYDVGRYDDLQMNIAQFPRSQMLCRNVQAFRGDRSGVSIPDQPCVLYFSNVWREELLAGIMNYVRESYSHKPRRMYLILENTDDQVELTPDTIFYRVELPLAEKLKLKLFSPMDFQVYRSVY